MSFLGSLILKKFKIKGKEMVLRSLLLFYKNKFLCSANHLLPQLSLESTLEEQRYGLQWLRQALARYGTSLRVLPFLLETGNKLPDHTYLKVYSKNSFS